MKPCKLCPSKRYGNLSWCYSHFREREKKKREEKAKRKLERKLGTKKHQLSEKKKLHRRCWKLMSEWVRRKDADWRGYNECYTCGARHPWNELHAGHHFHGRCDFDARNLRPQCVACNTYKGGMLNVYARKLIEANGLQWYTELEQDAARHGGYSMEDLLRIEKELKQRLENLK